MAEDSLRRRQDMFGLRDIGLSLSTEQGDAQSMMHTADQTVDLVNQPLGVHTVRDTKGSGSRTDIGRKLVTRTKKVTRYFPGQAPKWLKADHGGAGEAVEVFDGALEANKNSLRPRAGRRGKAEPRIIAQAKIVASSSLEGGGAVPMAPIAAEARRGPRVKAAPLILAVATRKKKKEEGEEEEEEASPSDESSAEGDAAPMPEAEAEEDVAARRARIRARLKSRAAEQARAAKAPKDKEEAAVSSDDDVPRAPDRSAPKEPPFEAEAHHVKPPAGDDDSGASGSSEYESGSSSDEESSSSDEAGDRARPVFVPRSQRATIEAQLERERQEAARREKEKMRKKAKAAESRAMVADVVMRASAEEHKMHFGAGDDHGSDWDAPDDADDLDDPLEFEAWRVRELARAHREANDRAQAAADAAETERRRQLTPADRAREDRDLGKGAKPEKAKWKFLQKYHHKGAFFMDDETLTKAGDADVRNRETDGAVGGDKFDKVKDFGFAGRTKYTHLADQDTTYIDKDNQMNGWINRKTGDVLRSKYNQKMGGTGDIDKAFERRRKS